MATITTTIRWEKEELEDIKKAAKTIGLPVALYIKSEALKTVRKQPKNTLFEAISAADADLVSGEYEVFDSPEAFLKDLRLHIKK